MILSNPKNVALDLKLIQQKTLKNLFVELLFMNKNVLSHLDAPKLKS